MTNLMTTDWQSVLPELAAIEDPEVKRCVAEASRVTLEPGTYVFHIGDPCESYLLVLAGDVRVQLITETGRVAVLYHVRKGDSCVLTTSCLLGGARYPAEAVVEAPTQALAINNVNFHTALDASAALRRFVFANLGQRFADVIARMEQVAFGSVDRRLARALLRNEPGQGTIDVTHDELASETGTAREVVSRHLKRYEEEGWLQLGRGHIKLLDLAALENLADTDS